jgi:serine/threonine protein kinase
MSTTVAARSFARAGLMARLDPQLWAEAERLLVLALVLRPEERNAFLERECGNDAVRGEVTSLLEHAGEGLASADAAIAAAAAMECAADPELRWIGAHFGAYKLESIIGHGGMGAVYRASRDDAEFRQQVAIKLLRAAAQSPSTLQRFKQERQILASLQHPNIARLLDGGSTPDGVPYLVMEFVEGEAITEWCERHARWASDSYYAWLAHTERVASAAQGGAH